MAGSPNVRPHRSANPLVLVLRWVMRLDRPLTFLSAPEIDAQLERDYTWNFSVNVLDGAFWFFGYSFLSSSTILPLFLSKLTTDPLAFGILAIIAGAGWALPQLFVANSMERLPRMKPVIVNLGFFLERLPIAFLVLCAALAAYAPRLAIVAFLLTYAWHVFGSGTVAVSWQDLVARIFPPNRRGRVLGLQLFIGAGTGVLGATFSTWLLKTYSFPLNFVYCFSIATVFVMISWVWLAMTREPAQPVVRPRQSNRDYLAGLPALIRGDPNYRHFLISRCLMTLGGMGAGFVTVSAVERWNVPDATVGGYTIALLLGQTAGNLVIGFVADRFGHKLSMLFAIVASGLGYALAWLAPGPQWYFLVFVLLGIGFGGVAVSGILIVMEFCAPELRPRYIGVTNTTNGLIAIAAPLIGTVLARHSYSLLFAIGALFYAVAFAAMYFTVRDPRFASPAGPIREDASV